MAENIEISLHKYGLGNDSVPKHIHSKVFLQQLDYKRCQKSDVC
jgi:hypothetical protein